MKYESRVEAGFRTRLCVCVCYRAFSPKSIISFRFLSNWRNFGNFCFFSLNSWNRKNVVCVAFYFLFFFKRRLPCSLKSNIFFPESNSMRNAINYIKRPQFNWHTLDGKKFDDLITTDQRSTKTKIKEMPVWKKSCFHVCFACFFGSFVRLFVLSNLLRKWTWLE